LKKRTKKLLGIGGVFDRQGHRGARGLWPENTLAGFLGAAGLGVDSVELDVVLCRDGVAMVYHDLRLNPDAVRRNGAWIQAPGPALCDLPSSVLDAYDVGRLRPGSALAARFPHQAPIDRARIPALSECLRLMRGRGVRLDIELKVADGNGAALLRAVLEAVDAACAADMVCLRSFDAGVLRQARAARPSMPLAWLTPARAGFAGVATEAARGGWPAWRPVWAPDHRGLRRRDVAAAQAAGLSVKPWTVNTVARMRQLRRWGVDGLCSDYPDRLRILDVPA
jgi:glycerophosphoryl diester phosphodiesterase